MRKMRTSSILGTLATIALLLVPPPAVARAEPIRPTAAPAPAKSDPLDTGTVRPQDREQVLGRDWQQSKDRAWTTFGDSNGFHVLIADANDGYTWKTAATLWEQGFDSDLWIGNACVTASGKRAVVVYAPRAFTNKADLFDRGGFTATVDLDTGVVTKVPIRSSIAYFNPGCGTGETAVITQDGSEDLGRTKLTRLDVEAAALGSSVEVAGQITSAVPTSGEIVAADGANLVRISDNGEEKILARSTGTPFHLHPDADGGIVFMDRLKDDVRVRRALPAEKSVATTTLATGAVDELAIASGKAGSVAVTGRARTLSSLPPSVKKLDVPRDAKPSTEGAAAVDRAEQLPAAKGTSSVVQDKISLKILTTGKNVNFVVAPGATITSAYESGKVVHPKLGGPQAAEQSTAGALADPVDADRTCSIPRNDPNNQVTQPTPEQVEWAADRAVLGTLENTAGAQSTFPSIPLIGGQKVPPQILLGIAAQESNLWQAARFALPGVSGNPLIGNYYGLAIYNSSPTDDWDIRWGEADCGYGITQVTDGMRLAGKGRPGEVALPSSQQRAIALDHKTNIARGLQILQTKWNETRTAGLVVNDGNPRKIENWFFAVWAYNSGFNPDKHDGSAWGLGWLNNPVNPRYPENRLSFLEFTQEDARNPQLWPYPEKVMGWAAQSITTPTGAGFAPAWWTTVLNRRTVKPPYDQFCNVNNQCVPGQHWVPDDPSVQPGPGESPEKAGPCDHRNPATGKRDLKCWWNGSSTWKPDCDQTCGNWVFTYDDENSAPPFGNNYPPQCTQDTLPANALIIDDQAQTPTQLPTGWASSSRPCQRNWTSSGTFDLAFGTPSARIDLHQIGAAFDNHFFFAHTGRNDAAGNQLKVTGTWTLNRSLNSWARVLVHIPDHGAHTQQAKYEIDTGSTVKSRSVLQRTEQNKWVSLGVFQFTGTPKVKLSNITENGRGEEDIAWDAIAFQPMTAKPANMVVALGDSYSSGEGVDGNYYKESDNNGDVPNLRNGCHRSPEAWSRQGKLTRYAGNTIGQIANLYNDPTMDYQLIACSGARTYNVLPTTGTAGQSPPVDAWGRGGLGKYGELSQLDRGFVDENTTLVTISIGGNDARFLEILQSCTRPLVLDCGNVTLDGDSAPLSTAAPEQIRNKVMPTVKTAIQTIHRMAPNAKIVLMGYPVFMQEGPLCLASFTSTTINWLRVIALFLGEEYRKAVTELRDSGIAIDYADPISAFTGKGACGLPQFINFIVTSRTPGETSDSLVPQQSFHPNHDGWTLYGDVLTQSLVRLGL
jgi:hypothetical protein